MIPGGHSQSRWQSPISLRSVAATVTLLVTDIVDSTRLWAECEAAMRVDLEGHDELIGEVVGDHGGRVFKHTGDGALSVFQDPLAAVNAASEFQARVGTREWTVPGGVRVRVAVHSGLVYERESDLFGASVSRACRLLGVVPAGAVVLSDATVSLLTDRVIDGVMFEEVGEVLLRGLREPSRVYALTGSHLAEVQLADRPEPSRRAVSLPAIDGDLVGRDVELVAVIDALERVPVVSLVGVGGMGKTRLALEAASRIAAELQDVWWVDLTPATSSESVPSVVLAALAATQQPGREVSESVVDFLTGGGLVVLDNCEHVLRGARDLVQAVTAGAPKARMLATSREALGLRGETVVTVTSLETYDAVALFCERATEARPGLDLDEAVMGAAAEICGRLDDIPLAIELAAARCRSMAPSEIAARLDDRFRMLRSGRGAERHRTLAAVVGWSYDLLDDDERDVFNRLAVFAGGVMLDALAQVCDRDEYDVLDIVDRLIARSLVTASDTPLGTRYRQLETLRQFGEDRLAEQEILSTVRDAHLRWVRDFAARVRRSTLTPDHNRDFARYVAEIANLRVAVAHALACGNRPAVAEIISQLGTSMGSHPTYEVLDWCEPLPDDGLWTELDASATAQWSNLALLSGDVDRSIRALEAIPPEFARVTEVGYAHAMRMVLLDGDFLGAASALDCTDPHDGIDGSMRASGSLLLEGVRLFARRVDAQSEVDAIVDAALAEVEAIRPTGDDVSLAAILMLAANVLNGAGRPAEGLEAASEAVVLATRCGAGMFLSLAENFAVDSLTQLAADRPDAHAEIARRIRAMMLDHQERRHHMTVSWDAQSATVLIWHHDPRTALLIASTDFNPITLIDPTAIASRFGPDERAEIAAEAAELDAESVIALTLSALERIIASPSP